MQIIARLPNPSEDLVKGVAEIAFNPEPQVDKLIRETDFRPIARATLARLGARAHPYADKAFAEISIGDSMGTSAAQIAIAGGRLDALPKVEGS